MILVLEVRGAQASGLGASFRRQFGPEGGVIGRASTCDWVLPHAKVSARHAVVSFADGAFYLEDKSTNGVFVNQTKERLVRGRPHALQSGDKIFIDPYDIRVSVSAGEPADAGRAVASWDREPFGLAGPAAPSVTDPFAADPFAPATPSSANRIRPDLGASGGASDGRELDPLKLIGGPPAAAPAPRRPQARDLEAASPIAAHYTPPVVRTPPAPPASLEIPEDYNPLEDSSVAIEPAPRPKPGSTATAPAPTQKPIAPEPAPAPKPVSTAPAPVPLPESGPIAPELEFLPEPGPIAPELELLLEPSPTAAEPAPFAKSTPTAAEPAPLPEPTPTAAEPVPPVDREPLTAPQQADTDHERTGWDRALVSPEPPVEPISAELGEPEASDALPSTPGPAPVPVVAAAPIEEVPPSPPSAEPPRPHPAARRSGDLAAVLAGAGLEGVEVTEELARDFGRILRVVVSGVMDVLRSRQQIKDEFRMRMTQFRPRENNPLKFSANVEDALHNLLVKRNAAYLRPVEAFEDAFEDVRGHQLAMLAGMRVAFESMLAELNADRLQEQFDRQLKKGALLSVPAKLRYWELYRDYCEKLQTDTESTFRKLFGEVFSEAYEEQLNRLKAERVASRRAAKPES